MPNPENYTIGWICAVTTEYVAARAFLDEKHDGPDYVSRNDNNVYTLGRIGKHNVVIAVLPDGEYGIASAASVARDMLSSFPNVRIGLMVGIGGGVPSEKHDIRLGDIVVSSPRDGNSGVFQYDFGKSIQNQSFQQTNFLDQPPSIIRAAVNGLKALYEGDGHRIEDTINDILYKNKRLRHKYGKPDPTIDRLYHSQLTHPPNNEADCATACGDTPSNLIVRHKRTEDDDNPAIHYGLIASANTLMKDAVFRDMLAQEKDVLCFEMEAAGLSNHFPYLVVRGICDYCDTHKNKLWQGYAAMTAAAYTKDLLAQIPPIKVEAERKISEMISSVEEGLNNLSVATQDTNVAVRALDRGRRQDRIERWLQPPDPSTNYNKAAQQRHSGSGLWFLRSDVFTRWKTQENSFLWLYGISGCGKTVLSSAIIEDSKRSLSPQKLIYFYFDFTDTGKQMLEDMVRSMIIQLYYNQADTQKPLEDLFVSCDDGKRAPARESLY